MTSITQNITKEQEANSTILKFFKKYKIGKLLHSCNAYKSKGISIVKIFQYLISMVFYDRSMYMQIQTKTYKEEYSKNTVYRLLNDARINWQKFVTLLSSLIVKEFFSELTNENRKDVFIIDDTLFDRSTSKKTEMLAKVFDHCSMKFKKGFRLLTLGWSDGNSFLPVDFTLLSAAEDNNLLFEGKMYDGRTLASKRRLQARRKATEVIIELLQSAVNAGHTASYVLFDSWFSSPKTICAIKTKLKLDVISMVKISSKVYYEYQNENLSIKQIYSKNKKRRGRSKYLLSVDITVCKDGERIPAKIVIVKNKSNKKTWLAILSTDISLKEEEIIRLYGKRWDIEVFFKVCKSYLKLVKETRTTSYDGLNAHIAIVFTRYMLLSIQERCNTDERTICELYYVMMDELADITFNESFNIIMEALLETVIEFFQISEDKKAEFTSSFFNRLPKYMKDSLNRNLG